MWMMLQADQPGDSVVASDETLTLREVLARAYGYLNIEMNWQQCGKIVPRYYRPAAVVFLTGDATQMKRVLAWGPKVS
jgi:GDPmannose 4,6-dehydratase